MTIIGASPRGTVAIQPELTAAEELAYSTVRIEVTLGSGDIATGTGFFFSLLEQQGGSHVPVIVTNYHVIAGGVRGLIHITIADGDGPTSSHLPIHIDTFESRWLRHPDLTIDLAAMPLAPLLREAEHQGIRLFYRSLGNNFVATASDLTELSPAEDIVMIGYPNGIWDQFNNQPVFRKGITATHPGKLYNGKPEFMIDAACFPGSSGSPVFLYNNGEFYDRRRKAWASLSSGPRIKLLGILYAGPQYNAQGEIVIVQVPTQNLPIAQTKLMLNLGYVIRAEKLIDFEQLWRRVLS